jgi:hypothetical protein
VSWIKPRAKFLFLSALSNRVLLRSIMRAELRRSAAKIYFSTRLAESLKLKGSDKLDHT